MKNNNKKETPETIVQESNVSENMEIETVKDADIEMKISALEEKVTAYEEKIDLIVSYLETINEKNRNDEIDSVIETDDVIDETKEGEVTDHKLIAKSVYEMARKDLYNELLPLVECAKKYKNREERDKVIKMMILTEEMADAQEKADEMDEIIEKYPALKNSDDIMEKYVTAYVILKGRDACFVDKNTTHDKLMELFETDDEFKKEVTVRICEDLKKQNAVPNMNFDGGITSLNIEDKPKNMKAAKDATFRLFK